MTALDDLISAVEAATGADREIDRAVRRHFNPTEAVNNEYTSSIDAVVALIRREMPGAEIALSGCGDFYEASVWLPPEPGHEGSSGMKPYRAALALLLAFLRAKAQQDETP